MTPLQIAELCHEVNRAYCRIAMGDESQMPWEAYSELPPAQRVKDALFNSVVLACS